MRNLADVLVLETVRALTLALPRRLMWSLGLSEVAREARFVVNWETKDLARAQVSISVSGTPLEPGLRRLLERFNIALVYSTAADPSAANRGTRNMDVIRRSHIST